MAWFRVIFLLAVFGLSSGYRFRCYMFCTDQTSTQNDYIEQRDRCREYAELKLDMSLRNIRGPIENRTRKGQLVALFNECMASNGWNIENKNAAPPPAALNAPQPPAPANAPAGSAQPQAAPAPTPAPDLYEEKAALSRTAECMFARHAAANSSIAAARAKACDLECAARLKAAPEAPRPASCPTDTNPDTDLGRGNDKDGL